jgi:hypothetical protein
MEKSTKQKAEELDGLLDELCRSNVKVDIFKEGAGIVINERIESAQALVENGYAKSHKIDGAMVYEITPEGRQFYRAGGYRGEHRGMNEGKKNRRTTLIAAVISGLLSGLLGFILGYLIKCKLENICPQNNQ